MFHTVVMSTGKLLELHNGVTREGTTHKCVIDDNVLDFVHLFCTTYTELEAKASICKSLLKKTGMLWVSWPKSSSKIPTDLKRDTIREYLLKIGLVDVKVAAINADWSGTKVRIPYQRPLRFCTTYRLVIW